jgi:hypothetical protein
VPGIIVAPTDAESATLLDGSRDERDQPFILTVRDMNDFDVALRNELSFCCSRMTIPSPAAGGRGDCRYAIPRVRTSCRSPSSRSTT